MINKVLIQKCAECGCTGIHACLGKPRTKEDVSWHLKAIKGNKTKLNNYTFPHRG